MFEARLELKGVCQFRIPCELRGRRTGEDDVGPARLDPIAVFVEPGVNAGGANDHVRCFFEGGVFHTLEDVFEDAGEFTPSPRVKPGGVGVAIK